MPCSCEVWCIVYMKECCSLHVYMLVRRCDQVRSGQCAWGNVPKSVGQFVESPPQSNSGSFLPPGEAEEEDRLVEMGKYDMLMLTSSTALGAETTACTCHSVSTGLPVQHY